MNSNKVVIAILFSAFLICLTIYITGAKPAKVPMITVPESSQSQTMISSSPMATLAAAMSPTEGPDDLSPIAIGIAKEFNTDASKYIITKSKQIGEYAIGGVTEKGEQGGAQWWGVKINGVWKYIFSGQSYPKCSVIAAYQIPKALLDSCIDDATNTLKQL